MAMTTNQLLQVTVAGRALGQSILNVLHYRVADPLTYPPAGEDIDEFVGEFITGWRTNFIPLLTDDYEVITYQFRTLVSTVEDVPGDPATRRVVLGDASDVAGTPLDFGQKGGEEAPTFVAVGIRKVSQLAGRRFRGNMRMGPILEADTSANFLVTAVRDQWIAAADAFRQVVLVGGFGAGSELELCVFSRTSALEPAPPQTNLRQFTSKVGGTIVSNLVTSQVSRKAKVGGGG